MWPRTSRYQEADARYRPCVPESGLTAQIVRQNSAAVFVFVTVDAEIFPIGAVGWIVVVVAVAMVNSQQVQGIGLELAGAFGADPTVKSERTFAIPVGAGQGESASLLHDAAGRGRGRPCWSRVPPWSKASGHPGLINPRSQSGQRCIEARAQRLGMSRSLLN